MPYTIKHEFCTIASHAEKYIWPMKTKGEITPRVSCYSSNVKRKQMQQGTSVAVFLTNAEKAGQEETHSLISDTALS